MSVALARAIDALYADVVMEPGRWTEDAYAEWMEGIDRDVGGIDRAAARSLRRAVRIAQKLQRFWGSEDAARYAAEASWEARVDLSVGIPAWRPGLELAQRELAAVPSPDAFEEVKRRFRVVNGAPWMEGVDFEGWRAADASASAG